MTMKSVVVWSLAAGLAASVAFSIKMERDKRALAGTVAQLSQDLSEAQETIAGQTDQLASLQTDLSGLQGELDQAYREVARLQTEQAGFRAANARLSQHVADLARDNDAMHAKLASIKELKSAIRTVKAQLRQERWQQWLARLQAQQLEDRLRVAQGNLGYMVRNGVSTVASTTAAGAHMQVRVLEPQLE